MFVSRLVGPRGALSLSMLLAIGVAATAFNMRAAIVGLGPLLDAIREDFGISTTVAGLLTTLPVVCFGTLAGTAPLLARRFGIDRVIWFTMVGLTLGILVRTGQPLVLTFVGTAIIGGSIALANVLVPAVIKRDFPERTGLMTGVYTMCLTLGGALSAGLMVPIVEHTTLGWRGALGLLAVPSLVAVVLLLPRLRLNRERHGATRQEMPRPRLWRNRLAWYVSLFMGLQSFVFFGAGSWMAVVLADNGLSDARAGLMWSLCNAAGLPASMLVPIAAQRVKDQRLLMLGMAACWVVAVAGLLVAPASWTIVWMVLFGMGGGSALSLALMFIVLRSPDTAHAAALSGMAQAIGYCLAAFAPFLFGALHDITGGWESSLVMILVAIGAMVATGWVAAQRRLVAPVQPAR